MDSSKLRQKVLGLDEKRRNLLSEVLRPLPMVMGYLYQMRRRCGNPHCKCMRGELHGSWYLSRRREGKTKLSYVGRVIPEWLSERARRYQRHQKILASIRKIDHEISSILNQLRDEKVKSLEQELGKRR